MNIIDVKNIDTDKIKVSLNILACSLSIPSLVPL